MNAKRNTVWLAGLIGMLALGGATGCGGEESTAEPPSGTDLILAPDAEASGVSLTEMASAMALFSATGNDMTNYPDTPVEVLFVDHAKDVVEQVNDGDVPKMVAHGSNAFEVAEGKSLYVPLWWFDDSPPIIGHWPADEESARSYVFDPQEVGGEFSIEIDGESMDIGPEYVAGPVETDPLPDGGGTHYATVAVFLSPMTPGDHTIVIRGSTTGAAMIPAYGFTMQGEGRYDVHVKAK